jgi:hypothetical protein
LAKLTSEELQTAKKRAGEKRVAEQQRIAEERALEQKRANERNLWLSEAKQRHNQLVSVVQALYDEVDKLSRKWPTMPITQLTLEKTNRAIAAVKELLKNEGDDFAEDIAIIVPAGDLPETRDTVLILRQVQAALNRFERKYESEWRKLNRQDDYYDLH